MVRIAAGAKKLVSSTCTTREPFMREELIGPKTSSCSAKLAIQTLMEEESFAAGTKCRWMMSRIVHFKFVSVE